MNGMGQPGRLTGKTASQLPPRPGVGGPGAPQGQTRMPPRRTWLWFAVLILINFLVARYLVPGPETPVIVPYTLFRAEVGKHNVEAIYSRGETLTGRFVTTVAYIPPDEQGRARGAAPQDRNKGASAPAKQVTHFVTTLPAFVDPGLEKFLIDNGVQIRAEPIQTEGNPWATLLYGFGPALLIIGFYVWMFRRAQQGGLMGGGLMGIGQSKARRYDQQTDEKVTFDDVAGIDEAKNELVEIVDFLKNPPKVHAAGRNRAQGRAPGRLSRHREDAPCPRGGRRSGRAVLLDERRRSSWR